MLENESPSDLDDFEYLDTEIYHKVMVKMIHYNDNSNRFIIYNSFVSMVQVVGFITEIRAYEQKTIITCKSISFLYMVSIVNDF